MVGVVHRQAAPDNGTLRSRPWRDADILNLIVRFCSNRIGIVAVPDAVGKYRVVGYQAIGHIDKLFWLYLGRAADNHRSCVVIVGNIVVIGNGTLLSIVADHINLTVISDEMAAKDVVTDGCTILLVGNARGRLTVDGLAGNVAIGNGAVITSGKTCDSTT